CPLLCHRRAFSHHILRGPVHLSIYPREIGTGVIRSGGTRNRVQHHAATPRLAGAQQRRRCASRGTVTRSTGITKCPVRDAIEAVLAQASIPRLLSSSTQFSPPEMIPSVECRS